MAVLALRAPDLDVEVVRLVLPLAGRAVLAARVDGDAQVADRGAARQRAQLGVAGQVPGDDDDVEVRCGHGTAPCACALCVSTHCRGTAGPLRAARRAVCGEIRPRPARDRARRARSARRASARPAAAARAVRRRPAPRRRLLDHAVAHDAVGDAQRVLERGDQRRRPAELEQVVLGLRAVVDLVGERPHAPGLVGRAACRRRRSPRARRRRSSRASRPRPRGRAAASRS